MDYWRSAVGELVLGSVPGGDGLFRSAICRLCRDRRGKGGITTGRKGAERTTEADGQPPTAICNLQSAISRHLPVVSTTEGYLANSARSRT